MKHFVLSLLLLCIVLIFTSSSVYRTQMDSYESIANDIKQLYHNDIDQLRTKFSDFENSLYTRNIEQATARFIDLRRAYKRVEILFAYHQEEGVTKKINGAPLPKVDQSIPGQIVIAPRGLQAIDESLCAGDLDHTIELTQECKESLFGMLDFELVTTIKHRHLLEAMRSLMVRIYTLSMTAFDTPACADPKAETISSLEVLQEYLKVYQMYLTGEPKKIVDHIIPYLDEWQSAVENNTFEDIPRLHIVRNFMNPAYSELYDLHRAMGIELAHEVDPNILMAYNYEARTIFDETYLNKSFFSKIASTDLEDSKKIELGKLLFYDPVLSRDLKMSCATCHQPNKAFQDGYALTPTRHGQTTKRNSPTLINAVYANKYFWDLREYDLERQVKHVMYDHNEFDMDFIELADRLKGSKEYLDRFADAYGDRDKYIISTWSISNALATYVSSLTSFDSPFDRYVRGDSDTLAEEAIKGHDLFMGKANCGTCHFAPTFAGVVPPTYLDTESEVLGVPVVHDTIQPVIDSDLGRAANKISRDEVPFYIASFKTMTVRNSALTAPYFHHGGYTTLEEVIDFYDRGGGVGMGLEVPYQTLPEDPLNLTPEEKGQLIAFIHALTDTAQFNNPPKRLPRFEDHQEYNSRKVTH